MAYDFDEGKIDLSFSCLKKFGLFRITNKKNLLQGTKEFFCFVSADVCHWVRQINDEEVKI